MRIAIPATFCTIMGCAPAMANCVPPYSTMFACNILDDSARVEVCEQTPDGGGNSDKFSYNFARGTARSELYFETPDIYGSAKFYRLGDPPTNTLESGLVNGHHVYSVVITGELYERVDTAQVHVYESLTDFQDKPESDIQRLYCDPRSVIVNWDHIGPG